MTSLRVELADLAQYAQYLMSMKGEVESSKSSLISTLESIKGSWKGVDADTFVANATGYLENLSVIASLLEQYGGVIGGKVNRYIEALEAFYS